MTTFSSLIPESELWSVIDSSKMQDFEDCRRKFFYRHILGWRPAEGSDIHLETGTAGHAAMEVLSTLGYTPEACARAFEVFLAHYRKHFPPEADESNKPKTPANFLRMLPQYITNYRQDDFTVLHVETAGVVHVSEDRLIHFKMDTICKGKILGFFSLEHKFSSRFSSLWESEWRQKIQAGTYNHVLYSLFPREEVYGVIINGIFLHDEPKKRRDGENYAGAKDTEFHRVPVRFSPEQMEAWRLDVLRILGEIQENLSILSDTREDELIMTAFPRNRQSCSRYGVCPYLNHCSTQMNPVRDALRPPARFEVQHWDPRAIPTVKEKMEL